MEKTGISDRYTGRFTWSEGWDWTDKTSSPMEDYPWALFAVGSTGQTAVYDPEIRAVGQVRISAWMPEAENPPRRVEYEIHHSAVMDTVVLDPAADRMVEDGWLNLGTFSFSGEGGEFVTVRVVSETGVTRLSAMRFEILNDALAGDVWQNLYVGPDKAGMDRNSPVQPREFTDLSRCRYRREIETLTGLGAIPGDGDCFCPDAPVQAAELTDWFHRLTGQVLSMQEPVTLENAVEAMSGAVRRSGVNLEWAAGAETGEALFRRAGILAGELLTLPRDSVLTRGQAAALLKGYDHAFVAAGVPEERWKLTFADDFDGEQVDEKVWLCHNQAPGHIRSSRWSSNLEVRDGKLRLLTKKEKHPSYEHLDWTTGSISVRPEVFSQRYGYWQASLKINGATGLNNAFWMIGNGNEIDVVEAHYPNVINTNYHHNRVQHSQQYTAPWDLSQDFHVYAVAWSETELVYYFDGKQIAWKRNIAANDPLYPIFSTAVLNWAGKITDAADGCAMEVEWVRVFRKR